MSKPAAVSTRSDRVSRKVRAAIETRVRQGLSITVAAEAAGMSRNGFAKALKRPVVQEYLRQVQEAFVAETEASRAAYKARAFEAALDLMLNAQSETVRARMIEFLAGEGKASQVTVQVESGPVAAGGYAYIPPGRKIVEIVGQAITEPEGDSTEKARGRPKNV